MPQGGAGAPSAPTSTGCWPQRTRRWHGPSILVAAVSVAALLGGLRAVTNASRAGATVIPVTAPPLPPSKRSSLGASRTVRTPPSVAGGISPGAVFEAHFAAMSTSDQAQVMSAMKVAGVRWVRIDTPGDFRFNNFVQAATANGIAVDAVLQGWTTPLTQSAFSAFAAQAVATLQPLGVNTYEILNEPNCDEYCLSASSYTQILRASYSAIKAADPAATVLTAGMGTGSGPNEPYNYLSAMYEAGAEGSFDAFNMHPYSFPDTALQVSDHWNPWSYLPKLHSIMTAHGDGAKQIWLTEFGCPTGTDGHYPAVCTDTTEAAQITDAFHQARQHAWTRALFIYDWQDDPNTPGDGDFGLYSADGRPKTASLAAFDAASPG